MAWQTGDMEPQPFVDVQECLIELWFLLYRRGYYWSALDSTLATLGSLRSMVLWLCRDRLKRRYVYGLSTSYKASGIICISHIVGLDRDELVANFALSFTLTILSFELPALASRSKTQWGTMYYGYAAQYFNCSRTWAQRGLVVCHLLSRYFVSFFVVLNSCCMVGFVFSIVDSPK